MNPAALDNETTLSLNNTKFNKPMEHSGMQIARQLILGPLEALGAMATFFFVLHGFGWQYGETLAIGDPSYLEATSSCLMAIVLA